jgi:cell division protein FtsN
LNQEPTAANTTASKGNAIPATYNIIHFDKYWIQIGCFSETKTKEDLQKMFHLKDSDKIEVRNGGNCRKYWVGFYNNKTEADKKLNEISEYGECKVVLEKWNASMGKYVLAE